MTSVCSITGPYGEVNLVENWTGETIDVRVHSERARDTLISHNVWCC